MKIYLDRRGCNCWAAACETCFSWNYLDAEIRPNYCLVDVQDDQRPARTFYVQDRDGSVKTMVVDEHNWPEFHDSWQLSWEKQQAGC